LCRRNLNMSHQFRTYQVLCGLEWDQTLFQQISTQSTDLDTLPSLKNVKTTLPKVKLTELAFQYSRALDILSNSMGLTHSMSLEVLKILFLVELDAGHFQKCETIAWQMLNNLEGKNDTEATPEKNREIVACLHRIALWYRRNERFDEGIGMLGQAIESCKKWKFEDLLQDSLLKMGVLYLEKSELFLGEQCFQQTMQMSSQIRDDIHPSIRMDTYQSALNDLGCLNFEKKDYSKAETMWETALGVSSNHSNESHKADILANLGELHLFEKNFKKSQSFLQDSIKIYEKNPTNSTKFVSALHILANLYQLQNGVMYAEGLYKTALNLLEERGKFNPFFDSQTKKEWNSLCKDFINLLVPRGREVEAETIRKKMMN